MSQSSESEIRAAITEKFKQYKDSRVNAIARTTSTASSGAGKKEAWKTVKIKSRWLTQRDGDTRPTHRMADGQVEDATGYFHVGGDRMKSPGTGHAAKENVNCRCTIAPAPNQSKHINAMRKVYSSWCDERAGKELLSGV